MPKNLAFLSTDDDVNLWRKFETSLADLLQLLEGRRERAIHNALVTLCLTLRLGSFKGLVAMAFLVQVLVLVEDETDSARIPLVRMGDGAGGVPLHLGALDHDGSVIQGDGNTIVKAGCLKSD